MKLLLSILVAASATPALAKVNITPTATQPVCLQRVYTQEHMKKVPAQQLSEVTIKVYQETYVGEPQDTSYTIELAKVIGRSAKNGKLYGNTAARNGNDANGNAFFQIDCDGGSFSLKQRSDKKTNEEWVNFIVTPGYYFPVFKGVLEPDIEKMGQQDDYQISLDGDDVNNSTWRLEEVPLNKCEEKISQIEEADGGC